MAKIKERRWQNGIQFTNYLSNGFWEEERPAGWYGAAREYVHAVFQ
jgi:hypothetical protein